MYVCTYMQICFITFGSSTCQRSFSWDVQFPHLPSHICYIVTSKTSIHTSIQHFISHVKSFSDTQELIFTIYILYLRIYLHQKFNSPSCIDLFLTNSSNRFEMVNSRDRSTQCLTQVRFPFIIAILKARGWLYEDFHS